MNNKEFKISIPQVTISSIILCLFLLILFPYPKFIILLFTISIIGVLTLAIGVKHISSILQVKNLNKLTAFDDIQLQAYISKQYKMLQIFLSVFILPIIGLIVCGVLLILIFFTEQTKDIISIIILCLGAAIAISGVFFATRIIKSLIYRAKNKEHIISELMINIKQEMNKNI